MEHLLSTYFYNQVRTQPQNACLDCEGKVYDYHTVNQLVEKLKNWIIGLNIKGKVILVSNEHSFLQYASILAIQFSGNAFLPVDFSWPQLRIAAIVRQVRPAGILVPDINVGIEQVMEQVPELRELGLMEGASQTCYTKPNPNALPYPHIAYILFTSGSTGEPKGVPVSVFNLNSFISGIHQMYDFRNSDRFLQVFDLTFDVAYFSFFVPMTIGACCCLLQQLPAVPKSLCIVNDLLNREISVVSMVPTVIGLSIKFIGKKQAASVRHCFFIGDALHQTEAVYWQKFIPKGQIHNFYGPTEATIACSDYLWTNEIPPWHHHGNIVSIGKVFPHLKYAVLDEQKRVLEMGKEGELAIAGDQVVSGYLGKVHPDKFVFLSGDKEDFCYYRTGDLVKETVDGNLLFLGRIDHQVKLNGFRIELAEVQLAITKITGCRNVVLKKKLAHGHYGLQAFVEDCTMEINLIKLQLESMLPSYMLPERFTILPELPLNSNGKFDYPLLENWNEYNAQ